MKHDSFFKADEFLYSHISGNGIYQLTGETVKDPLDGHYSEVGSSPLIKNVITGEEFYIKLFEHNSYLLEQYSKMITNPPCMNNILWPCDIIELNDALKGKCDLFVGQTYPEQSRESSCRYALVFKNSTYPGLISGTDRFDKVRNLNWKDAEIKKLSHKILAAIEKLNTSGYIYEDIHFSRFFFDENDDVFLNFSNLIFHVSDTAISDSHVCRANDNEYPIEFAEPAIVGKKQKTFDAQSQNFSICSLLFYMFFNRLPYDGRLLSGYIDDSPQSHYIKFRDYHKMPVFIFDPDNAENALGLFDEEQFVVGLWNECPDEMKETFISTLRRENAERTKCIDNLTPGQWITLLKSVGWINE